MRLVLSRDAGPVVRHSDVDETAPLSPADLDVGAGRRIFDGVVHHVDEDLDDQLCVDPCQQIVLAALHVQVMLRAPAADVAQSLSHHLVHQLRGDMQVHPPLLQPADRQQVFHQIDEPHGVVVDVAVHLLFDGGVKERSVGEKVAGISQDGGERGAQVVGDGPEQVGAKLFVFGPDRGGLFFLQVFLVFHGQGAFSQHGEKNAGLKGVRGLVWRGDAHHGVDLLPRTDGQIGAAGIGEGLRSSARPLIVGEDPPGGLPFLFGEVAACGGGPFGGENLRLHLSLPVQPVYNDIPLKDLQQLLGRYGEDLALGVRFLEVLVGLKQKLGTPGHLGGVFCVGFQLGGQGAAEQGGEEHHQESDRIAAVIGVQGKPGFGEKEIEGQHAGH